MKLRELKVELNQKPHPCYLVAGEDAYLRHLASRAFVELIPPDLRYFNLTTLPAKSLEPSTLRAELEMLPLGSDIRVCLVNGWQDANKELQEAVGAYLDRPNPTLVLGLISDRKPDLRFKLSNRLKTAGLLVECETPKPEEIVKFLRTRSAAELGYELPQELAELVVDLCGNDLGSSVQAVLAMADHAGERKLLNRDDAELVAGKVDYKTATKMTEYIGKKQPEAALGLARKVLEKEGEPEKMVGLLERHGGGKGASSGGAGRAGKAPGHQPLFCQGIHSTDKELHHGEAGADAAGAGQSGYGQQDQPDGNKAGAGVIHFGCLQKIISEFFSKNPPLTFIF